MWARSSQAWPRRVGAAEDLCGPGGGAAGPGGFLVAVRGAGIRVSSWWMAGFPGPAPAGLGGWLWPRRPLSTRVPPTLLRPGGRRPSLARGWGAATAWEALAGSSTCLPDHACVGHRWLLASEAGAELLVAD